MRIFILMISLLILLTSGYEASATTYFVSFKYKSSANYALNKPLEYLSSKAINRRVNQHIPIDSTDLPVFRTYISLINSQVDSVYFASKWLNGVLVKANTSQANSLFLLDFVKNVKTIRAGFDGVPSSPKMDDPVDFEDPSQSTNEVYGEAFSQVKMLKGDYLHDKGFKGKGVTIAVLDGGFENFESLNAFTDLMRGRIVDTYDYTKRNSTLRSSEAHGTKVLSLLTGVLHGKYCGSATESNYALYITESSQYEELVEEYNWCLAAERADSIGCDIITSSLGYSHFDYPYMNHTINDLSKNSTPISIAASYAFKKGMLTVVSAGNEGNKLWGYITFPADSPDVLAVGAVNSTGRLGVFSSIGLPGTVKPDVVSMGVATSFIDLNGNVVNGNGTSYASPQIAGFAACLWQAYPNLTAIELKNTICKSSSNYLNPDNLVGYGVPNFEKSFIDLNLIYNSNSQVLAVSPNPFITSVKIITKSLYSGTGNYYLYDMQGKILKMGTLAFFGGIAQIDNLERFPSGMMILKLIFDRHHVVKKVLKVG